MRETSGSVFKAVLVNPLVWVGLILTGFTLHYEGKERAFDLFYQLETYRNLSIGAAFYVALFDRHYKRGGERLDIGETLMAVLETMYTIIIVWILSLFLVTNYHIGGENYSAALAERYRKSGWTSDEATEAETEMLKGVNIEAGKRYRITPYEDGSFTVEVIED